MIEYSLSGFLVYDEFILSTTLCEYISSLTGATVFTGRVIACTVTSQPRRSCMRQAAKKERDKQRTEQGLVVKCVSREQKYFHRYLLRYFSLCSGICVQTCTRQFLRSNASLNVTAPMQIACISCLPHFHACFLCPCSSSSSLSELRAIEKQRKEDIRRELESRSDAAALAAFAAQVHLYYLRFFLTFEPASQS